MTHVNMKTPCQSGKWCGENQQIFGRGFKYIPIRVLKFNIAILWLLVVELRAAVGLIEAAGDNNVYSGQHQHHPSPSPILKPSIVMTAPRCLPRFPVPPAASDGSVGAADEVPPLGPSEVGTISQHDANIRILADLTAILAVAKRGSGGQ